MAYEIKVGNTTPSLRVQCTSTDPDNPNVQEAADLTNSDTIVIRIKRVAPGTTSVDLAGGVSGDATEGWVEHIWADGETDTAGTYQGEVKVTFTSGKKESFPTSKTVPFFEFEIVEGLSAP